MAGENFLKRFLKWLSLFGKAQFPRWRLAQKGDGLVKLLQMLGPTEEVELTCDEVFALLDQYVEMARGEGAAHLLPCSSATWKCVEDCREYEAGACFAGAMRPRAEIISLFQPIFRQLPLDLPVAGRCRI
jgi:hypothetical protein